jgi:hypothetical protein
MCRVTLKDGSITKRRTQRRRKLTGPSLVMHLSKGFTPMQRCYKFLFFFIQPRSAENEKTCSQYKRSCHGTIEPISRTKYPSPLGNRKHDLQIH